MGAIRKSVELEYPRLMVWDAITNRKDLAEWLMPNDFEPVIGHKFTFQTDPAPGFDGIVQAEVLELEPPERLAIAWRGGGIDTVVTFVLTETAKGTRLNLTHDGFALRQLPIRVILSVGWRGLLRKKLPAHISQKGGLSDGT
ncbi:MAG: SRPBCC domain-containing protein [Pseudomonadota bacterium]